MRASPPLFVLFKRSLQICISLLVIALTMPAIRAVPWIHASGGRAHFSMEPSFAPPYNVHPRPYFTYNVTSGDHIVDHLSIVNDGSARGTLHLYTADATTAQTSGTTFLPENAPRRDVGTWIRLSSENITLNPGQNREVAFTLTVPVHMLPGQYGGGIIGKTVDPSYVTSSTQSASISIEIQNVIALGVLVNLPGATAEKLAISDIKYDVSNQYQRLLIGLSNTGTQLLQPAGSLQVVDAQQKLLQNVKIQMDTFLPHTAISYPVNIQHKPLEPGQTYTARLSLLYGQNHRLSYESTFQVAIPHRGPLIRFFQNLGAPVATPMGNFWSQLTLWDYAVAIGILFLIVSSLFFWGQNISKIFGKLLHKNK